MPHLPGKKREKERGRGVSFWFHDEFTFSVPALHRAGQVKEEEKEGEERKEKGKGWSSQFHFFHCLLPKGVNCRTTVANKKRDERGEERREKKRRKVFCSLLSRTITQPMSAENT